MFSKLHFLKLRKRATNYYFTYYSYVVIILFNTGLYKSAFSTDSFEKLVVCISAFFASCQFDETYINVITFARSLFI